MAHDFTKLDQIKLKTYTSTFGEFLGKLIRPTLGPVKPSLSYTVQNTPPTYKTAFRCCGAATLENLGGTYLTTENHKQEFVNQLQRLFTVRTIYFLPTTYQIVPAKKDRNSVLGLLLSLGARELDAHINRNHPSSPNKIHMMMLDPGDPVVKKNLLKYIVQIPISDPYGYVVQKFVPRYVAEECGAILDPVPVDEEKVEVVKPKVTKCLATNRIFKRDSMGRFA
jgi:hypothetical protein